MKTAIIIALCLLGTINTDMKLAYYQNDVINVKDFGAKGDGVTDDYLALKKAAGMLNQRGTGTLLFPKGVYYLAPYHTKTNNIEDIIIKNCKDINVIGEDAEIQINGNINRTTDATAGGRKRSSVNCLTPFSFINCRGITFTGFSIDGNVDKALKDQGVVEGSGHLIRFSGCSNVKVKSVNVHHGQTDGIYITGRSSNVLMEDVISSNNARQGMSVIELTGGRFINCKFINTGYTGGKYGGHSPRAGVDIEPHTSKMVMVKDLLFQGCTFEGNMGGQFEIVIPNSTESVTLKNCIINAGKSSFKYQLILACKNAIVQDCQMDLKSGDVYPVWKGKKSNSTVTMTGCTIKSSSRGIIADSRTTKDTLLINNNQFIYTGTKPAKHFLYFNVANLTFTNNSVMIPSKYIDRKTPSIVWNAIKSTGNKFLSDNPKVKPTVSYTGTKLIADK